MNGLKIGKYLTAVLLIEALILYISYNELTSNKEKYLTEKNNIIRYETETTLGIYKGMSHILYDEIISQPDVVSIVAHANNADTAFKARLRIALKKKLSNFYSRITKHGFKQLHFHLANNESFLRFHSPERYGDDLSSIRYSVREVNRLQQPVFGFEEGRIYNGFRNVFPLTFNGRHVGSVELSISFKALQQKLEHIYASTYRFLVAKQTVDAKVYPSERNKHYILSGLSPDYYCEKRMIDSRCEASPKVYKRLKHINLLLKENVEQQLHTNAPFAKRVTYENITYLVQFLPIANIQGKTVAYIVGYTQDDTLNRYNEHFWIQLGVANLFIIIPLLLFFVFKGNREKQTIQAVLDTQRQIVIVTNGKHLIMANRKFKEFFRVPSVKEFTKYHDCICDLFIENDAFFHLKKLKPEQNWVTYLYRAKETERIVSIVDSTRKEARAFSVDINMMRHKKGIFVVAFTDITEITEQSHMHEYQATHDALTGVYNRTYFNNLLKEELELFNRHHTHTALLMFDIDHFKKLNDTYGHLAGDYVLKIIAKEVAVHLRGKSDTLIRWGGEEFIVLLPNTKLDEGMAIAQKLRNGIATIEFDSIGTVTASFGVTVFEQFDSITSLIERVDNALYKAKDSGRNCVISEV